MSSRWTVLLSRADILPSTKRVISICSTLSSCASERGFLALVMSSITTTNRSLLRVTVNTQWVLTSIACFNAQWYYKGHMIILKSQRTERLIKCPKVIQPLRQKRIKRPFPNKHGQVLIIFFFSLFPVSYICGKFKLHKVILSRKLKCPKTLPLRYDCGLLLCFCSQQSQNTTHRSCWKALEYPGPLKGLVELV